MSKKHHENCPTNCLSSLTNSEISPSRKTIFKSPLSNHIPMSASKQPKTVSYGQLQIILQNVQSIKAKAFASIRQVEEANEQLQAQINAARDELMQFKELQAREQGREREIEAIRRGCQQEIKRIRQAAEHTNQSLQALKRQYEELARAKREVDEELIESRRVQLQNEQRSRECERKYEELVAQLTEGRPKTLGDIIWRLKECHPLSQFFSSTAKLAQQITLLRQRASQLQEMNESHRQATASTAAFFQQLRDENAALRESVQHKEEEASSLRKQLRETTVRYQEAQKCKDAQFESYSKCISESFKQSQKCQCEEQRVVLSAKLKELDEQIESHGKAKKEEQQRQAYQRLVEGLCHEEEDYAQLVDKLKYFQSFKSEHYYNVEKIEYLCRMLDSM